MGLNIGLNAITSGGLFIVAILLVLVGILLVSAASKVRELPEFDGSDELENGYNKIKTAYILIFVAAGVALILGIVYAGHDTWWSPSEWIHTLFFLLIAALVIIGLIYAYVVLDGIYTPELPDRNGADGFIWASLLIGLVSMLILMMVGSGRAGYNAIRSNVTDRFNNLEHKVHLTHSHLTGEPIDYDSIGVEGPNGSIEFVEADNFQNGTYQNVVPQNETYQPVEQQSIIVRRPCPPAPKPPVQSRCAQPIQRVQSRCAQPQSVRYVQTTQPVQTFSQL